MREEHGPGRWVDALSPERKIVVCCARARIDPGAKDVVRALVRGDLNWADVLANAEHHGLLPIVYESIAGAAQDLVAPAQWNGVRDAAAASTTNDLSLLRELLRLHRLFEAARLPAISYKGPVLAEVAYGSAIRREYEDLDFAVPQKYIPDVVSVLRAAGYRPLFDPREAHAGEDGFAPGQYAFQSDARQILVEFHTERTLRYFPVPLDFQELGGRLMTVEIGGQRFQTFSIEDTLVMLSVHGAKHFWERLGWVLDIAELATVHAVDWALLLEIAAKMKATRVLLLGLYLAHEVCGAALPESVLEIARGDRKVQRLAREVREQYAGVSDPRAGIWRRASFRIRSSDGIGEGLRHMLRLSMSPTESDREMVRLPRPLAPLYVLLRPWRLLRKYGAGLKRR